MSRTARRAVIFLSVALSSYIALYFLLAAFSYDWNSPNSLQDCGIVGLVRVQGICIRITDCLPPICMFGRRWLKARFLPSSNNTVGHW
jgi:hypothetical protein